MKILEGTYFGGNDFATAKSFDEKNVDKDIMYGSVFEELTLQ